MIKVRSNRTAHWFWIDNLFVDHYLPTLSTPAVTVYLALARQADNKEQVAWPSLRTMAEKTGISRMTVIRALKELETTGLITITERHTDDGDRTSNIYTLLDIGPSELPGGIGNGPRVVKEMDHGGIGNGPYQYSVEQDSIELDREEESAPVAQTQNGSENGKGGGRQKAPRIFEDDTHLTVDELVQFYNTLKPKECPGVTVPVSTARRKKYGEYLKQYPTFAFWITCIEGLDEPLLRGLTPTPGHEHFRGSLDWLCQRGKNDGVENCVKVYEGRYGKTLRDPLADLIAAANNSQTQ